MDFDLNQPLPRWTLKFPTVLVAASKQSGGNGAWIHPEFRRDVIKSGSHASPKKRSELALKASRLLYGG